MSLDKFFIEPPPFRHQSDLSAVTFKVEIVCHKRVQSIISNIFKYVSSMILARYPSCISKIEVKNES